MAASVLHRSPSTSAVQRALAIAEILGAIVAFAGASESETHGRLPVWTNTYSGSSNIITNPADGRDEFGQSGMLFSPLIRDITRDHATLHRCALVNRLWFSEAIRILWQQPTHLFNGYHPLKLFPRTFTNHPRPDEVDQNLRFMDLPSRFSAVRIDRRQQYADHVIRGPLHVGQSYEEDIELLPFKKLRSLHITFSEVHDRWPLPFINAPMLTLLTLSGSGFIGPSGCQTFIEAVLTTFPRVEKIIVLATSYPTDCMMQAIHRTIPCVLAIANL